MNGINFEQYPTPWEVFEREKLPRKDILENEGYPLGGICAANQIIVCHAQDIGHFDASNWKQTLQGICDIVNASQSTTFISFKNKIKNNN